MTQLFYSLAVLACPLGMGVMMWMMMRGGKKEPQQPSAPSAEELTRLRAEVDQLKAAARDTDLARAPREDSPL